MATYTLTMASHYIIERSNIMEYGHKHTLIVLICQLIKHTYACCGRKLCYGTIEDIADGILVYFKGVDFNKED